MGPNFEIGDHFRYPETGDRYVVVGFDGELVLGRHVRSRGNRGHGTYTYIGFHPDLIRREPTNPLARAQWGIVIAGAFHNWPGDSRASAEKGCERLINGPAAYDSDQVTLAQLVDGVVFDADGVAYPLEDPK